MRGTAGDKRTAPDEPDEGGASKRQKQGRDGGGATKQGEMVGAAGGSISFVLFLSFSFPVLPSQFSLLLSLLHFFKREKKGCVASQNGGASPANIVRIWKCRQ
jgi:hypothetical protein